MGHCGIGYKEKVIRKMEFKETQTLDDLHEGIIYQAFKWDDPHLYSFFLDNKPYSRNRQLEYSCSDHLNIDTDFDDPNSTNIKLKELNLKNKQKFLFVFDFGDDHHFEIEVEDFGEAKKGKKYPNILEETGIAPEQYPEME